MTLRYPFAFICCLFANHATAQIAWEIVNRFPLFSERAFTSLLREEENSAAEKGLRLTQIDYREKIQHLEDLQGWDRKTRRYLPGTLLSDQLQIIAKSSLGSDQCAWVLIADDNSTNTSYLGPCNSSPKLSALSNKQYKLTARRISDGVTQHQDILTKSKLIVVLGDSFASGEGNPDYPAVLNKNVKRLPTDWAIDPKYPARSIVKASAKWLDDDCHRSILSWPTLYALQKAISEKDTVVRFASYACSGAEVIDGFLLPQRNPPGHTDESLKAADTYLASSQQNSLAALLCHGQTIVSEKERLPDQFAPYLAKYKKRKSNVIIDSCSNPIRPDQIFLQFGGNDTGFSGVVKYVFHPPPLKFKGFPIVSHLFGDAVNFGIYKGLNPIKPEETKEFIDLLPSVYSWLSLGLSKLNVSSASSAMVMLQYPDPLISIHSAPDEEKELRSCNARTRDANTPIQNLMAQQLGKYRHDGALYGVSVNRLKEVKVTYIPWLLDAQKKAAASHNWRLANSSEAFLGRGLCAGSLECEQLGEMCATGDRVRWNFWSRESVEYQKFVSSKSSPGLTSLADFQPYDPTRLRGMRYANDAVLTSARLRGSSNAVRLDWIYGIAHPTANIHARIAASLTP